MRASRAWHYNVPRLRSLHASQVLTHKAVSDASEKFDPLPGSRAIMRSVEW
jgi:hypothetical protein